MTRPAVLTYMSTASNARRRHRTPAGRPTLAPSFPLVVKNLQKLDIRNVSSEDESNVMHHRDKNISLWRFFLP